MSGLLQSTTAISAAEEKGTFRGIFRGISGLFSRVVKDQAGDDRVPDVTRPRRGRKYNCRGCPKWSLSCILLTKLYCLLGVTPAHYLAQSSSFGDRNTVRGVARRRWGEGFHPQPGVGAQGTPREAAAVPHRHFLFLRLFLPLHYHPLLPSPNHLHLL